MKSNSNLNELHFILQITSESFYEAIMLISQLPPELYGESLSSCERWLLMIRKDFDQFKKEVIGVPQHGEK